MTCTFRSFHTADLLQALLAAKDILDTLPFRMFLDLSTSHITADDDRQLAYIADRPADVEHVLLPFYVDRKDQGWVVVVTADEVPRPVFEELRLRFSIAFVDLLRLVFGLRSTRYPTLVGIWLDADGHVCDSLPTFTW